MDRASPGLRVELEAGPPATLPAGRATAAFCFGTCFHRHAALTGLEILVDGEARPVTAYGMPRRDLLRSLHPQLQIGQGPVADTDPDSEDDPEVRAYRSGFWATVTIPAQPTAGGTVAISLRASLEDGSRESVEVATIEVTGEQAPATSPVPADVAEGAGGGRIAICMSTFNPDIELFRRQIDSIRAQTERDWICIVSDDCSRPDRYREIEAVLEGDERFLLSRSTRRLGFYRGFERALALAPPEAELVALCDQDDSWYPDKLETLRGALGEAMLVYSDQRLVDVDGNVEAETYWTTRRNNHTNFVSMLVANTVTGAASLMRREVAERALPFPDVPGEQYHDHWLALVAMALGSVAYVDRPLYDYVQHGGAALGHAAANAGVNQALAAGPDRLRDRLSPRRLRLRFANSRGAYFRGYVRLEVLAQALLARFGPEMAARKRRGLRRFIRAQRSPLAFAWLGLRPLRGLAGRDETLATERLLAKGILWRYLIVADSRGVVRPSGRPHDASLPPSIEQRGARDHGDAETAHIQSMIEPLQLSISESEPRRVNVLIPTIDLKHLFGGYIAKFNLAATLARQGHRVRLVAVNPTPPLPSDWRRQVESYSGLAGVFDRLELAFARDRDSPLPVNPDDLFVATTWWTAHHAHDAVRQTNSERFLYLIQEYEPYTFVMGSWAALAMQTYRFPHVALFSTSLLRDFFAAHGHGVFAAGAEAGERDSVAFQNAITAVEPPAVAALEQRRSRKLLFYARAEAHAKRNMFELGLIAICEAIERGVFGREWEFYGIGSVGGRTRIPLPGGAHLDLLNRRSQDAYGAMLGDHDVGLSLMLTPHPSLPPIEMASAGLLTVTNSFETKTAAALEAISANLIVAEPTSGSIVAALEAAVAGADDAHRRVAGAEVRWPSSWQESFDAAVVARVEEMLARCLP